PPLSAEPRGFPALSGSARAPFAHNGAAGSAPAVGEVSGMLRGVPTSGTATVTESGIRIDYAPEGITFEPLTDHPRLGELVDDSEKFAAHNAAEWKHGRLVHVPKGVVLEQPLYVRIVSSSPGGALFWRLLVFAEPERPFRALE